MSIAVEIEARIARPPADVFAELADVERFPGWPIASGISRVEPLDAEPPAVGSRLRIDQSVGGRSTVPVGRGSPFRHSSLPARLRLSSVA